ncbi:hypothetical protein ABBQ32_003863 [Trebouxia sp. C0010 RCD-2024]
MLRSPGRVRGLLRQLPTFDTCRCISSSQAVSAAFGSTLPSPSKLEAIVNMDKMLQRTPEQIGTLWQEHHAKDQNAAVLGSTEWKAYQARAKACPNFVIPLRKPQGGYLTVVLQQQLPIVIFTTLQEFYSLKDQAPPHLAITHYTELLEDKGIVLAKADAISPHLISVAEARTLMTLMYAFYSDPVSFLHVHNFNHNPAQFSFAELAKELGIGTDTPAL